MNITGMMHVNVNCNAFERSPTNPVIDLLEWKEPRSYAPPYPHRYRIGIARVALLTADMNADVEALKERGIEFISELVLLSSGDSPLARFVCFKDPDGTILEVVETSQT